MSLKRNTFFIVKVISGLISLGVLLFVYVRYSWHAGYNSDAAAVFIMTREILKGNYFLKGWIGSTINGLTVWYIPNGLLMLFMGAGKCGKECLYLLPAITYLFTFIMALLIVRNYKEKTGAWFFVLLAVVGFPAARLSSCFFRFSMHIETINYLLLIIFLWTRSLQSNSKKEKISIHLICSVLILAANVGDSYSLTIINISLMVFAALELCINNIESKQKYRINVFYLLYPVLSVAVSKIIIKALNACELWRFEYSFELRFATWEDLGRNISNTLHLLFCFFGGDVFGKEIGVEVFNGLLGIAILVAALIIFVYTLFRYNKQDIINRLIVIIIVVQTCAYTFSSLNTGALDTDRYMTVPVIMLGILFVRTDFWKICAEFLCKSRGVLKYKVIRNSLISVLLFMLIIGKLLALPTQEIEQSGKQISDFLVQNNLQNGYGTFWNSHNITVENLDRVRIAPIYLQDNKICKQEWLNNQQYFEEYSNFIVINNNMDNITVKELEDILGKCETIYELNDYVICTWNYDISNKIVH